MDVSVVLPVYNGAEFVGESVARLLTFLGSRSLDFEVVVVDDGSTDDTRAALAGLADPRLKLVSLTRNVGKFGALKAGMPVAHGRCRVFTDADVPYDLEALTYIAHLVNDCGFHVVVGDRTLAGSEYATRVSPLRGLASRGFSLLVRLLVTGGLFDTQCGLKGFRADVAEAIFPLLRDDGFSGDVELLYVALKYNLAIRRVPVRLRRSGASTVGLMSHSLRMMRRIAQLRWNWQRGRYASPALARLAEQSYWEERP